MVAQLHRTETSSTLPVRPALYGSPRCTIWMPKITIFETGVYPMTMREDPETTKRPRCTISKPEIDIFETDVYLMIVEDDPTPEMPFRTHLDAEEQSRRAC